MTEQAVLNKRKSRTNWIVLIVNFAAVAALLLSYTAAHVPPKTLGYFSLFGLAYPFIMMFNLALVVYWFFKRRKFIWISILPMVAGYSHASDFLQFGLFGKKSKGTDSVKVLTYNVKLFGAYDKENGKKNKTGIFDLLKEQQPDIVCFQEFFYSDNEGETDTRDELIKILPTKYYHHRFTHSMNGRQFFGVAIFSKYPIISKGYIPFQSDVNNFCIYADVKIGDDTVRVYDAHLASIRFQEEDYALVKDNPNGEALDKGGKRIARRLKSGFVRREEQVNRLLVNIRDCHHPKILCGDFNDTPVSYCYESLTNELEDSFLEAGSGIGNTYIGVFPSFRIDYILHSDKFTAKDYQTLPGSFSDHHAVTATLTY